MAEPPFQMSSWGERLRERTLPLQPDDDQYFWVHAILCETLAHPYQQVAELIDPEDPLPPWAPLFSVDLCPEWALPWLAQLVGGQLPVGLTEEQARNYIRDVVGHHIGTVASVRGAILSTLTGGKTIYFRERDTSPYRLEVVTLVSETPDPALTLQAVQAVLPAGILLEFRQVEGWDYQALTDAGGTYAQLASTYSTYTRLRDHQPG